MQNGRRKKEREEKEGGKKGKGSFCRCFCYSILPAHGKIVARLGEQEQGKESGGGKKKRGKKKKRGAIFDIMALNGAA